jgi:DNA polymerase kappa
MAVGGESMLSTSNYEARKYGVVAAMPGYIARKLCPHLLIVPPNFEKYRQAASKFHPVFAKYDLNFTHLSLDEASLDLSKWLQENPDTTPEDLVQRIRKEVFENSGLTCSAGIAPNKLLAKICSNVKKPNGQFYLPPDKNAVIKFVEETPLRKLSGIGKVMAKQLQLLFNAETCKDLVLLISIFYSSL